MNTQRVASEVGRTIQALLPIMLLMNAANRPIPTSLWSQIWPYLMFPLLMAPPVCVAFWGVSQGIDRMVMLSISTTSLMAVLWALEYVIPHSKDWQSSDGQFSNDVVHMLFGTILGGKLGNIVTYTVFTALSIELVELLGGSPWPGSWPFAVQLVIVFVVADFGRYVQHRLMHRYDLLWRFHELHHSGGRLWTLKASRSHIVERFTQQLSLFALLVLMRAPADVIFAYVIVNSCIGFIAHSNVRMKLGPLNYILMGPEGHRIHHSTDMLESNSNFGSALVVWDILFNTFINGRDYEPAEVGIEDDPTPDGVMAQILRPFRPADPQQALTPEVLAQEASASTA